jgi:hypothetical protein
VFDRVKVFSTTKARDRESLGDTITRWLRLYLKEGGEVLDKVVNQSSDKEFHCLSVILFLKDPS